MSKPHVITPDALDRSNALWALYAEQVTIVRTMDQTIENCRKVRDEARDKARELHHQASALVLPEFTAYPY